MVIQVAPPPVIAAHCSRADVQRMLPSVQVCVFERGPPYQRSDASNWQLPNTKAASAAAIAPEVNEARALGLALRLEARQDERERLEAHDMRFGPSSFRFTGGLVRTLTTHHASR